MSRDLLTSDIRGQFILLGTGTSVGVPSLGCPCEVCASDNLGSYTAFIEHARHGRDP